MFGLPGWVARLDEFPFTTAALATKEALLGYHCTHLLLLLLLLLLSLSDYPITEAPSLGVAR